MIVWALLFGGANALTFVAFYFVLPPNRSGLPVWFGDAVAADRLAAAGYGVAVAAACVAIALVRSLTTAQDLRFPTTGPAPSAYGMARPDPATSAFPAPPSVTPVASGTFGPPVAAPGAFAASTPASPPVGSMPIGPSAVPRAPAGPQWSAAAAL